jgi:DUF1365 family protein
MMGGIDHIQGETFHGRRGVVQNAFRYSVDYVLLDPEQGWGGPALFSRNRANLFSVRDADHGGAPGQGAGARWAREVFARFGVAYETMQLLAQPRLLGHVFNPVSFWLAWDASGGLAAVIAEVTNTFGDRHSYIVRHEDGRAIDPADELVAEKIFHVSPFQPVGGEYRFTFDITDRRIAIRINYVQGEGGVVATLAGPRKPLTNRSILWAALRRPFGSRRVLALIHWQALKLFVKGAKYRARPKPPQAEVS